MSVVRGLAPEAPRSAPTVRGETLKKGTFFMDKGTRHQEQVLEIAAAMQIVNKDGGLKPIDSLQIIVNGSPALYVDLLATEASRPYAIGGGIVAAAARHPTRADTTFRMQLLAARCGSATTTTTR